MNLETIKAGVESVSNHFAENRRDRLKRRELDRNDFEQLKDAGYHLTGVLAEQGGLWQSVEQSTRMICDLLRILAHGDSSVALVSSMHPSVLAFWLATPEAPQPFSVDWQEQRHYCSELAKGGGLWGTITSEPGSGGDIFRTKTVAEPHESGYSISGVKHFGSGSGVLSYMITTAVPLNETVPDVFFMDMRDAEWDGSNGVKLLFPWDGHGMIATQSHSVEFKNYPATRIAWSGNIIQLGEAANSFIACCFTAVIVGIVETAIATARINLNDRRSTLKAFEQVMWSEIELDGWLMEQAYQGMIKAVEKDGAAAQREALLGKTAVAQLAETIMTKLCKVMGGGTYSRHSPFGFWFQDVRALGFLRPPWVLAYDQLYEGAWSDNDSPVT